MSIIYKRKLTYFHFYIYSWTQFDPFPNTKPASKDEDVSPIKLKLRELLLESLQHILFMSIPGAALIFLSIPPPRPIRSNSSTGPTVTNQQSDTTVISNGRDGDGDANDGGGTGSYGPPILSSEDIVAAVPVTYSSNPLYTKGIHMYSFNF